MELVRRLLVHRVDQGKLAPTVIASGCDLCIVYDNEALGLIERLLQRDGIEYKTEAA